MIPLVNSLYCLKCKILRIFNGVFDIVYHSNQCLIKLLIIFTELDLFLIRFVLIYVMLGWRLDMAFIPFKATIASIS